MLPSEDWPPSIGRHESNLVMIEHSRGILPGAKEAEQMMRDYVGGKVDRIINRKKKIRYEDIFDFSIAVNSSEEATYASKHFRMLINGAPGVGKTVLCRKFCKDWGAGKILQQFSMVWLLHLRDERIAKAKTIDDLFQHDDEDLLKEVVKHMKKTSGEGTALVCDGFDELNKQERTQHSLFLDIIKGKVLPNSSVIATSRPYASLELQQLESITHHVEIVGFTNEQIKECIISNINDKLKANTLIQKLKHRLDVFSLCYIPLNCSIMIYVYKQEDYQLPETLTLLYTFYIRNALKRSAKVHFPQNMISNIDLKSLPECMKDPFNSLCKVAYKGLLCDQLGFKPSSLPKSLQDCPGGRGTKPELLGLMSGTKSFEGTGDEIVSYQFTHLTVQEFMAAWYAGTGLSAEELSKLFIQKMSDDRFRMMLLFLSGITGLQKTQVYQQIVQKLIPQHPQLPPVPEPVAQLEEQEGSDEEEGEELLEEEEWEEELGEEEKEKRKKLIETHIFFLAHLIYESRNTILSHILSRSVQQVTLDFKYLDLFQCTVLTYFLSTSNYPWILLELESLTDEKVEVMQQVSCELAGSSVERRDSQTPLLLLHNDTKEFKMTLKMGYLFYFLPTLLNMKQLTTLNIQFNQRNNVDISSSSHGEDDAISSHGSRTSTFTDHARHQFASACKESLTMLFKALAHNSTLHKLKVISTSHMLDNDSELGKPLSDMLKRNTSLKHLHLIALGLTDFTATCIAAVLVDNHSLEALDISYNNVTSVGAASIFKALKSKSTLKALNMTRNKLLCRLHSPYSSLPQLPPVLPSSASTLPTQTTTSHSSLLPPVDPPLPSPITTHDGCVCVVMAGMFHFNGTLALLNVSDCGLTPQCSVAVFNALKHNSSLKKLVMSYNRLDTEALADMLSHNHSLTELYIERCDPQLEALARGLLHNTTLTNVYVFYDEKHPIMASLVELRRQEVHTVQPDLVVSKWKQVIKGYMYVCVFMCAIVITGMMGS